MTAALVFGHTDLPSLPGWPTADVSVARDMMIGKESLGSADVEEVRIPVPWGVVAAKSWGSSAGDPVVVIHGLNDNAGSFDRLVPLLPPGFRYLIPDLPGHGFSTPFPGGLPPTFMNYVYQLHLIVSHFQWERIVLVGHSFGGHVAEFYASTFKSKVEKLILLESWSPLPVAKEMYLLSQRNHIEEVMTQMAKPPRTYPYKEALSLLMRGRWFVLNVEAAHAILDRTLTGGNGGFLLDSGFQTRREIRPDLDEDALIHILKDVRCPVLVILGTNSELNSMHSSWDFAKTVLGILERSHPTSRIVRVHGNHCLHNNNPEVVAPVIAKFLFDPRCNL